MSDLRAKARRAGILYLLLALTGIVSLMYFSSAFVVPGDAAATAARITAGELTYRLVVFTGLVSNILFLLVGLSLYDLLGDVDRRQARLMLALVAVGAAVGILNLLNQLAPLVLLSGADFLSAIPEAQRDALAYGSLRLFAGGHYLAMAFWALWLLPFGLLVIESGYFPKILGVLLIVGCVAYLLLAFTGIVLPEHYQGLSLVALPFYAAGELAMIVYLLVKGARVPEAAPAG